MPPRHATGRGGKLTTAADDGSNARHLLSGKAKKTKLKEKRELDRQRAEKEAEKEKRRAEFAYREANQQRTTNERSSHTDDDHDNDDVDDGDDGDDDDDDDHKDALANSFPPAAAHDDSDNDGLLNIKRVLPTTSHVSGSSSATDSQPRAQSFPSLAPTELSGSSADNSLRTIFAKESSALIEERKVASRLPLDRSNSALDGSAIAVDYYKELIDIPTRPPWSHDMSAAQLHAQEEAYFQSYLNNLYTRYGVDRLNHFEHNLLVWKQLWRVCEQSDILCVVVDARHPLLNFPPALYRYITQTMHKPLVMVLNKIDLVPKTVIQLWQKYFARHYQLLHVIPFTSQPRGETVTNDNLNVLKKIRQQKKGSIALVKPHGAKELLAAVREIALDSDALAVVPQNVKEHISFDATRLSDGRSDEKAESGIYADADEYMKAKQTKQTKGARRKPKRADDDDADHNDDDDDDDEDDTEASENAARFAGALGRLEDDDAPIGKRSFITIGMLGTPNAGKSSLINSLAGKKVVSVSKTPGHTKYLQTLFLNDTTRLADCPGLVFPAVDMPRALQVIAGSFPIAQTRDPYSAVRLLAERLPLERIYNLQPPTEDESDSVQRDSRGQPLWSAWTICEALAYQKGFRNRHGVLDVYRAANYICRDALDGVIVLYFLPPDTPTHDAQQSATLKSVPGNTNANTDKRKNKSRRQRRRPDDDDDDEDDETVDAD